jgi:hypothetical protein
MVKNGSYQSRGTMLLALTVVACPGCKRDARTQDKCFSARCCYVNVQSRCSWRNRIGISTQDKHGTLIATSNPQRFTQIGSFQPTIVATASNLRQDLKDKVQIQRDQWLSTKERHLDARRVKGDNGAIGHGTRWSKGPRYRHHTAIMVGSIVVTFLIGL